MLPAAGRQLPASADRCRPTAAPPPHPSAAAPPPPPPQFNTACPGLFGTPNEFRKNYENPILAGRDADATELQLQKVGAGWATWAGRPDEECPPAPQQPQALRSRLGGAAIGGGPLL